MNTNNQSKKDENKGSLLKSIGPLIDNALISGQLFKTETELSYAELDLLSKYHIKIYMCEDLMK